MNSLSMMDIKRAEKAKQAEARIDVWRERIKKAAPWILLCVFFVIIWSIRQAKPY